MPDSTGMEMHSIPCKPYATKLQRFNMAGYYLAGDSIIASLPTADTANLDGLIEVPKSSDRKLLHQTPETVYTLAWMMPQSLKCRTASACMMKSAWLTKPASLIPYLV